MKIEVLLEAENEFIEAVSFYNNQREGLGFEFAAEVQKTLDRIVVWPLAWHPLSKRTRRCRTNHFPYGIIYQVRKEMILIVAVMHLKRHPNSWKNRTRDRLSRGTDLT